MALSKFNKWTQYLQRDILLETLEQHPDIMESKNGDDRDHRIMHAIVRNPNFDLARYSTALPHIPWGEYANPAPLSPDELRILITITNPNTRNIQEYLTLYDTHNISDLLNRASEQQIREIDAMGFCVVSRGVFIDGPQALIIFAGRMDISLDIVVRALGHLYDVDDEWDQWDVILVCEIASRKDLTPAVAKRIYEYILQLEGDDLSDTRTMMCCKLTYNPALSLDELYDICGPIPEIMLNPSFEPRHLEDPRFQAMSWITGPRFTAGNCNFFPKKEDTVNICMWFMNPRGGAVREDIIPPKLRMPLVKNEYNRHPRWNATCRKHVITHGRWLALVWKALTKYLPPELAESILLIWYRPCGWR